MTATDDAPGPTPEPEAPDDSNVITIHTEDDEQIARLAAYLSTSMGITVDPRKLQRAARRFVMPVTPEPTGLGAVVVDYGGVAWVRWYTGTDAPAWISEAGVQAAFADLDVAEVKQPGWVREVVT
jgi:hypothetical protein